MRAAVGGRGFANWCEVSRNGSRIRELDSQTGNCNTWRSLQFLGFLVERPPTHSLQFAEPLSTRTRRIPGSVRKLGTNTVPATHCKDSLSRPRRFANLGTPTAAVPVPNCVDRCAIPWTRIQYRQSSLQRSRLKTPATSITAKTARGASDDPRSSIGTVVSARRRLRCTSLERGRCRSNAWTHQARCLPAWRHRRRRAARDAGGRRSRTRGGVMITVVADGLTYVDLIWIEKRVQRWIRFGSVASEQIIDRHRSIVAFAPGDVFAFVRWASNDFGTV